VSTPPLESPDKRRVCLLTGAGGTLGGAFCDLCSELYDIVAVYRETPPGVASQHYRFVDPLEPDRELSENQHPVFEVAADLTQPGEIERVVELALARFDRIDLVVNAAAHSVWAPIVERSDLVANADRMFRVNVTVPLALAAEVARRHWRDRRRTNLERNCHVLNVSSMSGLQTYHGSGQSVYAASKAALNHLTRHMAGEFGSFGVRVNAIAPNAFPQPLAIEDVLGAIWRLDSGRETGTVLAMDGHREWLA
jgi:NAD(P)-dependent dehydrogenase (short-subunit alcohol dehydrogenase family)